MNIVTAFISGHRDVTEEEFNIHYKPLIDVAIENGHHFVVGDYEGLGIMAQRYLKEHCEESKVTVYHMFVSPRNHVDGFNTLGGFFSDEDRDSNMTKDSDYDIAWVRPGKEKSGTAINIKRRNK